MAKSKFFRVAVAGPTVDGRTIEESWLRDIAATYNRDTYAARVNMEHIRGVTADKPFKAYGDVLAFRTETVDLELGGKTQRKLALFAEIEPTEDLIAMNRDKQKIYASIEVNPNFAETGKAYGVGIAVTDSPASLGTETLTFAVQNPNALSLQPRVQAEGNIVSLGLETRFELEADAPADEHTGLFAAATAFFKQFTDGKKDEPVQPVTPPPANDNDARIAAFGSGIEKLTAGIEAMGNKFTADVAALRAEIGTVKASIESTEAPGQRQRPAASGASKFAAQIDF